jgi:hypothetical protein
VATDRYLIKVALRITVANVGYRRPLVATSAFVDTNLTGELMSVHHITARTLLLTAESPWSVRGITHNLGTRVGLNQRS